MRKLGGLFFFIVASAALGTETKLSVATFSCDVTPPLGHPLCGGWIQPLKSVDDPLLAKGVVLADGDKRYVLCSVDWCLLQTAAHDLFRRKIAAAANTPESRVAVHTVHQHNAPIADIRAQQLLDAAPNPPSHLSIGFSEEVTDRLAVAVRAACDRFTPVTHVGSSKARVEKFASSRRIRMPDGKMAARFSSAGKDPAMAAAPEGLIDPWLRTVTLFNGEKPVVRLHSYATHPQSFYGDGRVTSDTVGVARDRLEKEEGVPQIYFTGCGGDVTAGKYNDGSPAARAALTERAYDAMKRSVASTTRAPVSRLEWKTADVRLAIRTETEWSEERLRKILADPKASVNDRINMAALTLAWYERLRARPTVDVNTLRLGPVTMLFLPGEAFVEYQLYAQSLRPDDFIAVAAYGEGGCGYICCDAALKEGGYEPTDSRVGPPSEQRLKDAIVSLIGASKLNGAPLYPDKQHLLWWRDSRGFEHPITEPRDWEKRRAHILAAMQRVMGELPSRKRLPSLDVQVLEEIALPKYTRQKITFVAEAGDRVPAYVLIPRELKGKAPAMLCLHQTTAIGKSEPVGLGGKENLRYAQELAERGYVALAPDYPNFGDYKFDVYSHGYASATMKGIFNHMRAVDMLASLPQVDKTRIGAIGHSLGGHNSLFVAAFDPRIKAVVTSCGFNSFYKYYGGDLTGWSHKGYMPRIASEFGKDPKQMPFDWTETLAAIAPRAVFINAPMRDDNFEVSGVKDCLAAAAPVFELLGAKEKLVAVHPDCGHDFPPDVRQQAYEFLDKNLK